MASKAARGYPAGARPAFGERLAADQSSVGLRLGLMLLACVVAAGVTAALAFPVVGGLTAFAAHQSTIFDDLPADLATPPLPEHSVLLDDQGKTVIATLSGPEDRVSVPFERIPVVMQKAIISIEDSRFYEHHGVDMKGIVRAVVHNNDGGSVQGASTITQQYVKNVLIEKATTKAAQEAARARTTQRKIQEARYALQLERKLSKNQILERYLNIAYFGEGVYGVGTAALHYFNVRVESLTLPQAALLAGLVNNPTGFDPIDHPNNATLRRQAVLASMVKQKYVTQADADAAAASPLLPKASAAHHPANPDACVGSVAPFFCAYARTQLLDDPRLGSTPAQREDKLFNGGLRIRTTLDLKDQAAADAAVKATIARQDRVVAAEAMVEPGTGHVTALAENRRYGPTKKGSTDNELALFSKPTFQGGSTFKMFTLTAALATGIGIHTKISAPSCYHSDVFDNPQPQDCFKNAGDSEAGVFDLSSGTWFSVNTFFVQLEQRVGVQNVIDTAVKLGIPRQRFHGLGLTSGSVTLGAVPDGVAPIELANAYATIAAHGKMCPPSGVLFLQQRDNSRFTPTVGRCQQAVDPGVADTVSSILQGVLTQTGATAAGKSPGRPAAGKTGTLDDQRAAWFVGFVPQLASAVVLGDPTASSKPLGTVTTLQGQAVDPVFGGTIPASIWQASMEQALQGVPVEDLPPPAASIAQGAQVQVPNVAGLPRNVAMATLTAAGFGVTVNQRFSFSPTVPRNSVIQTFPGAGLADAGTTVQLILSNGPPPSPTAKPTKAAPSKAPVGPAAGSSPQAATISPAPGPPPPAHPSPAAPPPSASP